MKLFFAGIVLPVLLLAACGGGSGTSSDNGLSDANLDATPPPPSIATEVSTTAIKAGQTVQISCVGTGFNPTQLELVVREAGAETPPTSTGDAVPGEDAAVSADDPYLADGESPPSLDLPDGVTRQGLDLVFTRTDVFTVACYAPDTRMIDRTPARIVVRPGSAASVETAVTPTDVKAGETVTVTCTGVDIYGNPLESAMLPGVSPPTGVTVLGTSLQMTKTGTYQVACGVKDTAIADPTPVTVTVVANLPKRILTLVDPDTFEAGASATLTCRAVDYYNNPVIGFPISVKELPDALALDGKTLSGTLAGLYSVQCIPQTADWKYFTLVPASVTITAGPPVRLDLASVPKKPYYGKNETLTVTAEARDAYGNLVTAAQVQAPIDIAPPTGITPSATSPTRVFQLKEEGAYRMTFRLVGYPSVSAVLEVLVEGSGPLLTIEYPERGETVGGIKPSITVIGTVNDDVTGIKAFTVNGADARAYVDPISGAFSYILSPLHQGVNILTVSVTNAADMVTTTTRGFQYSPKFYPATDVDPLKANVPKGALAFLSRDFVDDGVHDLPPDDLATILEMVLAGLDLKTMLPNPLAEAGPYKITIPSITYGPPTIQLNLYDGGLHLLMTIPNLNVAVKAEGRCQFIIDWCPDVSGSVSFDTVLAIADVDIGMDAQGVLVATMRDVQVQLGGMTVHLDGILGTLLDGIINLLVDAFRQTLIDTLVNQVSTLVNETLSNLLSTLVIDQSIEIPALPGGTAKALRVKVKPSNLAVRPEGIDVALDGSIGAVKGVTHTPLGSIGRSNCLKMSGVVPFTLPWDQEVVLGAFDDLLNQALFGVWYGGSLNLKITQADLGSVDLSQYDVQDLKVDLDFYEAPILTDCNATNSLQAQIGDLYVFADLSLFGNPLQLGMFIQATAAASLYLSPTATGTMAVAVRLDDIPLLDIEVVSINDDFPLTKEQLMDIVQSQLIGEALKGIEGKELVSFEIPAIDMSGLSPSLPPGITLNIALTDLLRDRGYTVVKGLLQQPVAAP
jgi:hypothetical protein